VAKSELAWHWLPLGILIAWVLLVWLPRMLEKDRRLSRYNAFLAYKARRSFLFH
jgi:hypothetical protein